MTKPTLYYLGAPYNHPTQAVKKRRLATVNHVSLELIKEGKLVFSPLSHNLSIDSKRFLNSWEAWQKLDLEILARCDALMVLKLEGWQDSIGLKAEIAFAKAHQIPIVEMEAPSEEQIDAIVKDFPLATVP